MHEPKFDLRSYLISILDPNDRARAIIEGGLVGHPDIADIQIGAALGRGEYQQLLASLTKMPKGPSASERRRVSRGQKALEMKAERRRRETEKNKKVEEKKKEADDKGDDNV